MPESTYTVHEAIAFDDHAVAARFTLDGTCAPFRRFVMLTATGLTSTVNV